MFNLRAISLACPYRHFDFPFNTLLTSTELCPFSLAHCATVMFCSFSHNLASENVLFLMPLPFINNRKHVKFDYKFSYLTKFVVKLLATFVAVK